MNIFQNTEDKLLKHSCNIRGKQILTKKKLKQHQDEVHKNKGLKLEMIAGCVFTHISITWQSAPD